MPIQKHECKLTIDEHGYETATRGNPMFPCSAYWWELNDHTIDEIPLHWHEDVEVLYVKSGTLLLRINDKNHILKEGEGAFINSNVMHSIRAADNVTGTLNSLVFETEFLSGPTGSALEQRYIRPLLSCHALHFIPFRPAVENVESAEESNWNGKAARCVIDAYEAIDGDHYGHELVVRDRLSAMLHLIVVYNRQIIERQGSSEDKDVVRLKKMLSFLHQNYSDKINLQQIASAASISDRECLRCFNKTIGIPPIQYLLKYRLSVSAQLLTGTHLTITEICGKVGFDSPSHFTKMFKVYMSCAPSAYRNARKQG